MPFETIVTAPKRIAVIGAGISGMGAAYMLSQNHNVALFEAENRLGGHARTKMANGVAVDTGFIVFNYANYPHMAHLFEELNVPVVESNMSFGASIAGGKLEYGLANLGAVFAQRRNIANPKYLRMLRDIFRFNAKALELARGSDMTIGQFLDALGTGDYFRDYYLLPLSGAIWSTPVEKIMDFPAHAMIEFFENHALLHHTGQHQWFTVQGGSIQYVTRLGNAMRQRGVDIRLGAPIDSVQRDSAGVHVKATGAEAEVFDEVVFATHSDDTLRLLSDPSKAEADLLGAVKYQPNDIVLHSDPSIMPKRRKVWSSWNYTEAADKQMDRIDLTYWMNCLQPLPKEQDFFVTLNTTRPIRDDLIWDTVTLRHPVYDKGAIAAQKGISAINGINRTWFCGAWMKNGFHEDGLSSAVDVVRKLDAPQVAVAAE
ncbi:NAD(P)/FAD-dependent oxidoreductase [Parasulfitobacter algicola]|uniref:FAD-dependent oxidoreductase n=1 Tax=Parasulfitobacter algicola TaxID=2614809 RepID=A0ABX2IW09_9RHOB|nr:FAD-dependent oxidoreductase [Sulfitobacter algicola]NSX56715.1 FAD-dependent oxidoreductase [Sulfitobacter algicola]